MSSPKSTPPSVTALHRASRRQVLGAAVSTLASTWLLVACGGGGDAPAAAGGATPAAASESYAQGVITGFGSVFVGGVRWDDSQATVVDDDGRVHARSALKLGMMVELTGGAMDRSTGSALARRIRWGHEVLGPVGSIDATASTLQVLGQTVLVTASTVFDDTLAGGLAAIATGAVVEVHGILDTANNRIVATRIEAEDSATAYHLRGALSALDTTAKTFRIGSELISYAGLASSAVPANLADGQVVRVALQTTAVGGAWVATALRSGLRLPDVARPEARIEGAITAWTSTARFVVNGLAVDATNASFPDGSAGVVLGARVEVEGTLVDGVLVATSVSIEDRRDHGRRGLELRGELGSLDTTAKTFALRGVTVSYAGTVSWRNGTEATLANGVRVEVKGVLSADRTQLQATRIEFR